MANPITPEFRVSYPNVFTPKMNTLSKKEEYSIVALFPKGADLSKLEAVAREAIEEKWGPDKAKWPKNMKTPFRLQDDKEKDGVMPAGHEKGLVFMNLKSKQRPGLVDRKRQPIIDSSEFYAGCYAIASVSCYAYDEAGNRGVAFGLVNLQKTREGEPLSGRPKAETEFQAIAGDEPQAKTAGDLFG